MSENNQRDLELREWTLKSSISHFKDSIAKAEAELQEVIEALKEFATDSVETVQAVAETVVEKVEEVVEVAKEEVKKAAPKKAAAKKAEPATDESDK